MSEPFLFVVLQSIWEDLIQDKAYDSTKQSWQALQVIIDENKHNQQINKYLTIALVKCFYSSKKVIAEKCRDNLIKNSTFIQYRGAKIYNPVENDRNIKILETKIKLLEQQLKKIGKKDFKNQSLISLNQIEELLKKISESNYQSLQKDDSKDNQLFAEAERDCDVEIYKAALRDKYNGLRKQMFNKFLIEIEPKEQLNRIFNARTYLLLNNIPRRSN